MVPGFDRVLRCARAIVGSALHHGPSPSVLVRHAPTGRYLAADGTWTDDARCALAIDDAARATQVLARLSCEPVFDIVAAPVAVPASAA